MICLRKLKTCWRPLTPCCLLVAALTLILASFIVLPHLLSQNLQYRDAAQLTYRLAAHLNSPASTAVSYKLLDGRDQNSTQLNWNQRNTYVNMTLTTPSGVMKVWKGGDTKKYLIYLCDDKEYCYGLGDRQRGIVSVYLLAELTNRTFGVIMTSPSNFTEFYKPRLVNWDITSSELEGKTFIDIKVLGPQADIKLDRSDFNVEYPQDVVYIRTNQKFHFSLIKNPFYKDKLPKWAQVPHWKLYQDGWMRLMMPTLELRQDLNEMLIGIVQVMKEEQRAWHIVKQTGCCITANNSTNDDIYVSCNNLGGSSNVSQNIDLNRTCLENTNATCVLNSTKCLPHCINGTIQCITYCTKILSNCTDEKCFTETLQSSKNCLNNGNRCVETLFNQFKNSTEKPRLVSLARNLCSSPLSVTIQPNVSIASIQKSRDYDLQAMNLVCAHIRLGHSPSMPFETNVRNKPGEERVVWEFLKPYVATGHHVYLASDSEQVRQKAKTLFGYRLHISSIPIVHIASVQKGQDKRLGFRLALMEQLLLATSCSVLVVSYSGFSMKAAQIRQFLRPEGDSLFIYRSGKVVPVKIQSLQ